jgi:catechol 2,3-dioxygenase-like lactoylglutathione lyase family enzyme
MALIDRGTPGDHPHFLGQPVAHVGYSVSSISETVDFLVRSFGAGPFFLMENIQLDRIWNAAGPIVWEHSAAFGQWGGVAVELQEIRKIEPNGAFGAAYEGTDRFNHVAYAVDNLARESERLREMGFAPLFEASNGPHKSALYDAPLLGHTIEVHQVFDLFIEFHAEMARAADGWDGTQSLRPVPDEVQKRIVDGGGS